MTEKRFDGRAADQLRRIHFTRNYLAHPLASVLMECGRTKVLCSVSCEPKVPAWKKAQHLTGGWLTCEYGMLPASTHERSKREASSGKQGGRTMEIQRLIGRSLRSVIDLEALGQHTLYIDCDVIDADGGTRCAGITGAATALALALKTPFAKRAFGSNVMRENIAAVSVGIVKGQKLLDLCYEEDSNAEVDMNVVMTESGKLVEIQGTAEEKPFSRQELDELLDLASGGLKTIFELQKKIIDPASLPASSRGGAAALNPLSDALDQLKLS